MNTHSRIKRTSILCPECRKGNVLTEDYDDAYCEECGEQYKITSPTSVRYRTL